MMDASQEPHSIREEVDAIILVHRDFRHRVAQADEILERQFRMNCYVHSSERGFLTGNTNLTKRNCKLWVFIMTSKFIKEDLKHYESLLHDSEILSKENTLFILTGRNAERIPREYSHFMRVCFDSEMTSEKIAQEIAGFAKRRIASNARSFEIDGKHSSLAPVVYNIQANIVVTGGKPSIQQEVETLVVEGQRGNDPNIKTMKTHVSGFAGCASDFPDESSESNEQEVATEMAHEDAVQYEPQRRIFTKIFGEREDQNKRGYILITSSIHVKYPGLENIASIPWLRVFDFDPKSRVNGLLSVAEPTLKSTRHHTTTDLLDEIESLDDNITNWVFINGYCDNADTLPDENRAISQQTILQHSQMLTEHCQVNKVPTLLVLWYQTYEQSDRQFFNLMHGIKLLLEGYLGKITCTLCMEKEPEPGSQLEAILTLLDLSEHTLIVPLEVLCFWLKPLHSTSKEEYSVERLPKFPDEGGQLTTVTVSENDLKWINVCFDLLTMKIDNTDHENRDNEQELEEGVSFLKGAEISWPAIDDGRYDVTRDLLSEAREYVCAKHIRTGKSGVITIFHSPGGGGTAFARRLLWSLREEVPCVELKRSLVNLEELKDRLKRIRSITKLPVVMLVDGKSDHEIKKIMEFSRTLKLVVIHLQRYYSAIEKAARHEERLFLPDRVSITEADDFYNIFSRVARQKERKLNEIRHEITERKESHFIFEYGLAAFQSEFRGLVRYVHGYLQINGFGDLKEWQTALGFLSLANYYGNRRGLPCQLFSKLLQKDPDEIIYLDNLPHSASQFISEDKHGNWKITHYIVSLVILEQVLVRRQTTEYEWGQNNSLTMDARTNLRKFAIEFIKYISSLFRNIQIVPGHISDILTSIFIKRHNNDPGEKDFSNKFLYSRLLYDTGSEDNKLAVLEALPEHFPYNAEFQAHLGRFHYQHQCFEEATECLSRAESIRKDELQRRRLKNTNKGDEGLERICNMFGFCYNAHLKFLLGASLGRLSKELIQDKHKPTLIRQCLESAKKAIEKFGQGRKYFQKGSVPTFSYLGEIKARLQVTELARVLGGRDLSALEGRSDPYDKLKDFALTSFHECDHLLAQCIYYSTEKDIPEEEMNFCINNFQHFFKGAAIALERWAGEDSTVKSKKCHLSLLKLNLKQQQSRGRRFRIYDDIKTQEDLDQIVRLYEDIFDSVSKKRDLDVRISNYMMEWLQAIRHKNMQRCYSQTEVLTKIEKWSETKEIGSMATFYRYVVSTLISLSSPRGELANSYSEKSCKYKENMEHHAIPLHLLDKSIEWLGSAGDDGNFNQLINISSLGDWNGKFWNDEEILSRLKVCTGRIHTCKAHNGSIIIDGGQKPPIYVHFVPQRYNISVSHSKQKTRVEFYLGFNPRHKAEAFGLTFLQSYPCPTCKTPTEIKKLGKGQEDWRDRCRSCEDIVTPT